MGASTLELSLADCGKDRAPIQGLDIDRGLFVFGFTTLSLSAGSAAGVVPRAKWGLQPRLNLAKRGGISPESTMVPLGHYCQKKRHNRQLKITENELMAH